MQVVVASWFGVCNLFSLSVWPPLTILAKWLHVEYGFVWRILDQTYLLRHMQFAITGWCMYFLNLEEGMMMHILALGRTYIICYIIMSLPVLLGSLVYGLFGMYILICLGVFLLQWGFGKFRISVVRIGILKFNV